MKRTKKRLLSFALSAAMALAAVPASEAFVGLFSAPVTASAANSTGRFGGNATWTLDSSGKLTVTGSGELTPCWDSGTGTNYGIKKTDVKSLVIGEGFTRIVYNSDSSSSYEKSAFKDCTNLTSVTLPSTMQTLDMKSFCYCSKLATINFPAKLKTIGNSCFDTCTALKNISLPETLESIGDYAFTYSGLTSFTANKYLCGLGSYCFSSCASLSRVTLNEGLLEIGANCFSHCKSLSTVTLNEGLLTIGEYAFNQCTVLSSVTVPASVQTIGSYCFRNCESLSAVTLKEGLQTIQSYAFFNCDKLTAVTVPASVQSIGLRAFSDCLRMESLTVLNKDCTITVTEGQENRFIYNREYNGLYDYTGKIVGYKGSTAQSYASIAGRTFEAIEAAPTSGSCGTNAKWSYNQTTRTLSITGSGAMYDYTYSDPAPWKALKSQCTFDKVLIDPAITEIGDYAFYSLDLYYAQIPNTLTRIGDYAFANNALTSVVLPQKLTTLGIFAFAFNYDLNVANIPAGLTAISEGAFRYCKGFSEITLPETVTSVGAYAFSETKLTDCYVMNPDCEFADTNTIFVNTYGSITRTLHGYPNSTAEDYADSYDYEFAPYYGNTCGDSINWIYNKKSKTLYVVGDGDMYDFEESSYVPWYAYREEIEHIVLSDGITSIGNLAFAYCDSFKEVTIPASVENIGYDAFECCYALRDIYIHNPETEIYGGRYTICNRFYSTSSGYSCSYLGYIHGYAGSTAQTFCENALAAGGTGYRFKLIEDAPEIFLQPEDVSAAVGETAKFRVFAKGENLTYQWQYRKNSSAEWADTSWRGAKTDTLSVPAAADRNGYQYQCIVKNTSGDSATSNAATLTVTGSTAPKITAQPQNKTAASGTTAQFTVTATGTNLTYQWQYRKNSSAEWAVTSWSGAKTATLIVPADASRNGFQYRCVVTGTGGSVNSNAATLTVTGSTAPKISAPPQNKSAEVGETAQFTVTATGTNLTYQWQYSKDNGATFDNTSWSGAKTATLSVPSAAERNGYQYRCIITGTGGSVTSNAATLTVLPKITAQPKSVTAAAGATAKFTVTASGAGLKYQWQYSMNNGSTWANSGMTGNQTDTVSVPATTARNGQMYRCIITDANGKTLTSSEVKLTVS